MALADRQRDGFEERLKRIQKGGANTMGEVHIGPKDEEKARKGKDKSTVQLKKKKHKAPKRGGLIMLFVGLFIGVLCMFVGKAADFHMFAEGGLAPMEVPIAALEPYMVYAPFVFAGLLALIFAWTFQMSTLMRKVAVIAGLTGAVYFEGDLVNQFPGIYTSMFNEAYVTAAPEPKLDDLIAQATEMASASTGDQP